MGTTAAAAQVIVDQVTWGDRFRRLRLNRSPGQREFAAVLGIPQGTIGGYERADHRPRGAAGVEAIIELHFGREAADFLRGCPQSTDYGTTRADWALAS